MLELYLLAALLAVEGYEILSEPGYYTFVVAISTPNGYCTGAIVTRDWVLSAANCLYIDGDRIPEADVKVLAGVQDYEHPRETIAQIRGVSVFKVHPRFWDERVAKFDLALIKVKEPFHFNDYVGYINVTGSGWSSAEEHPNNCMSFGFGGFPENTSPVKFMKVWNVTAGHGQKHCPCSRRFQWRRLLCAKNADYAQLCERDDGGPLVCGTSLTGVAHMVRNWYDCSDEPKYGQKDCIGNPERGLSIYMMLCPFNSWMHSIVPEIPPTPASCRAAGKVPLVPLLVFVTLLCELFM